MSAAKRVSILSIGIAITAMAAGPRAQSPAFDVASVKPNNSRDGDRDGNITASRFRMIYVTVSDLLQFAYLRSNGNLRSDAEIVGGPGWLNSDHFDVNATLSGMPANLDAAQTAAGAATSQEVGAIDRVRLMVQTLLADRFKLTAHHEARDFPVYELVLARSDGTLGRQMLKVNVNCAEQRQRALSGPPAEPTATPCGGFRRAGPGHFQGRGVPMDLVADLLEGIVDRNVVDRTALTGVFDVDLTFTRDQPPPRDPSDVSAAAEPGGPSIFTAVREQLGLRLEAARGKVDVLVIDGAERPTPD